jgi:DUF1680 family protein
MASLHFYIATVSDSTLYIHQFTGCALDVALANGRFGVEVASNYPWSGQVHLTITAASDDELSIALRKPTWSGGVRLTVCGDDIPPTADSDGYIRVKRNWAVGDELQLDVDLSPRLTFPAPRIDALRGTAAVERGPLVYCFEEQDLPDGTTLEDVALTLVPPASELMCYVKHVGETVLLELVGRTTEVAEAVCFPYSSTRVVHGGSPLQLTALPYFQWDNRGTRAMRVWIPVTDSV